MDIDQTGGVLCLRCFYLTYFFPSPVSIRIDILCAQLLLDFSIDHLETMHTCSTWSENVCVILGLSCHYLFSTFYTFSTKFLVHLSGSDKLSFCDHILSVVCQVCIHLSICKQFLQTASPPKALIGFWPNFTGMILGWSTFGVV